MYRYRLTYNSQSTICFNLANITSFKPSLTILIDVEIFCCLFRFFKVTLGDVWTTNMNFSLWMRLILWRVTSYKKYISACFDLSDLISAMRVWNFSIFKYAWKAYNRQYNRVTAINLQYYKKDKLRIIIARPYYLLIHRKKTSIHTFYQELTKCH